MECPSRDQGWIPSTASGGSLSTPAPEDPSASPSFLGHILMHANIHTDTPRIHRAAGSSVQTYTQAHHIYTELQVLCKHTQRPHIHRTAGSVLSCAYCSRRRPRFSFWRLYSGPQPPVTPVPKDPTCFSGLWALGHVWCTHTQATQSYT